MAERKKRFALVLKNDVEVEDFESLRANFDIDKIRTYFSTGKLAEWLDVWRYADEADKIRGLDEENSRLNYKLCKLFEVDYSKFAPPEERKEYIAKMERLREVTTNSNILEKYDQIAFNVRELNDLIDDGETEIYLFEGIFEFPSGLLREKNRHYHGIGKVTININRTEPIDFDSLGITFESITFGGKYAEIFEQERKNREKIEKVKQLTNDPHVLENLDKVAFDRNDLFDLLDDGETEIYLFEGDYEFPSGILREENRHYHGIGRVQVRFKTDTPVDLESRGITFENIIVNENSIGSSNGNFIETENVTEKFNGNFDERLYSIAKNLTFDSATQESKSIADNPSAENPNEEPPDPAREFVTQGSRAYEYKNYPMAFAFFVKAANAGHFEAMLKVGSCYKNGVGVEQSYEKAFEWYKKAADAGYAQGMNYVASCYRKGEGVRQDSNEARHWYEKAAALGNKLALNSLQNFTMW